MRLTTSLPSCAECHEIWEPKPPETLWATPGLLGDSFITVYYLHLLLKFSVCGLSLLFILFYCTSRKSLLWPTYFAAALSSLCGNLYTSNYLHLLIIWNMTRKVFIYLDSCELF